MQKLEGGDPPPSTEVIDGQTSSKDLQPVCEQVNDGLLSSVDGVETSWSSVRGEGLPLATLVFTGILSDFLASAGNLFLPAMDCVRAGFCGDNFSEMVLSGRVSFLVWGLNLVAAGDGGDGNWKPSA